jgi:hypothetical protein
MRLILTSALKQYISSCSLNDCFIESREFDSYELDIAQEFAVYVKLGKLTARSIVRSVG